MSEARIKICGLTSTEDARVAAGMGVDYLGVIFADSPRKVDVSRAVEIREAVPESMLVGVFQNASIEDVSGVVDRCDVNMIQLHGDETPEFCRTLSKKTSVPIIKAFTADNIPDTKLLSSYQTTSFFLFDLSKDELADDTLPQKLLTMWDGVSHTRAQGFRVFLAGALDEDNVAAAIQATNPFAVDVCRGVESSPGVKDAHAMQRFVSAVRS